VDGLAFAPVAAKNEPNGNGGKKTDPTIGVPPDVHARFSAWCNENSYIRRDIAGKLLVWFMERDDDVIRKVVLRGTSRGLEHEYAKALHAIADEVHELKEIRESAANTAEDHPREANGPNPPNHSKRPQKSR
jgi:hypothetical protein